MAIPDPDLSNIITSTRQFDLTILAQIFDVYSPKIYRYILFRLGDESKSQELVTEVFNHLLHRLNQRPKSIDDLQTWLFEVTRKLVDQFLSENNGGSPVDFSDMEIQRTTARRIDLDETTWLGLLVRGSIRRLMPDQQHLLALRFANRYGPDEIARIMDKNINDIKGLQLEALVALRGLLEREA